ncbi:MAG: aldose epimerase family protein [Pseudomonadota bacterium]
MKVIRLAEEGGLTAEVLDYGAALRSIRVPTAEGPLEVLLAYPTEDQHCADPYFIGSTLGRFANRIAGGRFELDGRSIDVDRNENGHCLHGGTRGFHARTWEVVETATPNRVVLETLSSDGDQGFPGTLHGRVNYTLGNNTVDIVLEATTDQATVISLSNHAYFNLGTGIDVLDHEVMINADAFTPIDNDNIPTGELLPVQGSCFDFREPAVLGQRLNDPDEQLGRADGFDHNYVLPPMNGGIRLAARARSPETGVTLSVYTTQPGLQFYSGQGLAEPFQPFQGLCFEGQAFPDAPNQPGFPAALLEPGQSYRQRIRYAFEAGPSGVIA